MKAKQELKSMFTEYWHYLAVNAACKIQLFDKIFEGQNSFGALVQNNQWDSKSLLSLLKFLSANSYLNHLDDISYNLTEKGDLLREGNVNGLYYACLNWSGEHLIAWQNISHSIQSGKSSFEHIYQKPYFDYLDDNPEKLIEYHKAMYEYAIDDYKELPKIIDFSGYNSIMDVGAGLGAAISLIKEKNQSLKCFLFDLQKVVEQVANNGIERVGGDFFKEVPRCSEAIILARILHDWDDNRAQQILANCYSALPDDGTLYVIENCKDKIETDLSLLSLNMSAMCQSFERNSNEYIDLCKTAGLTFQKAVQLNQLQTILIFKK